MSRATIQDYARSLTSRLWVPAPDYSSLSSLPEGWVDYRSRPSKDRVRGARVKGWRDPGDIRGMGWHQTATFVQFRGWSNVDGIPAHFAIFPGGVVVALHPVEAYIYHGGHINPFTIGVEIVCREPGLTDHLDTLWMPKKARESSAPKDYVRPMDDLQRDAALQVAAWCVAWGLQARGSVDDWGNWCHRQGSNSRDSDPGEHIYRDVVAELDRQYFFKPTDMQTFGNGCGIPDRWTDRPNGVPYNYRHK